MPGVLPLDTGIWLDDLLSRIFTVLENLEAPETRADTSTATSLPFSTAQPGSAPRAAFLMDKQSMFKWVRPLRSCLPA